MTNNNDNKYPNRLCFNDWATYNAGAINCKWWPAGTKAADVKEFLAYRSPAHNDLEIYVADTDLNWPEVMGKHIPTIISEHCGLDDALNILALFDAASDEELLKAAYLIHQGICEEFEGALALVDDVHIIEYDYSKYKSEEEALGYYWADNGCIEVPDHLENYIDWEHIGRELILDGHYKKFAGDIYNYTN